MAETVQERQENELEVLKAIFGPQLISSNDCRREDGSWMPLECILSLGPQQGSFGPQEVHAFIDVRITCGEMYPEKIPQISLEKSKGLSSLQLQKLQSDLEKLAEANLGEVMIYELSQFIMNYLHQYNKPGFQSFYDEMVNRKQIQQQREMERRKAVEDKKRQEIFLEIQSKQEAMKKENNNRRRKNSNRQSEDDVSTNPNVKLDSPVKKHIDIEDLDDKRDTEKYDADSEDFSPWSFTSKGNSRIESEFEELQWLGEGAFGDVIKVRNKLDGCLYAIKRIKLNAMNNLLYKKITREVKLLSRLNHENVVRYFNSWIETCSVEDTPISSSNSLKSEKSKIVDMLPKKELSIDWSISKNNDNESSDDSSDDDCWITFMPGLDGSSSSSSEEEINENGSETEQVKSSPTCTADTTSNSTINQQQQFMYIQMEFCEKSTLRSAIDEGLHQDVQRVWRLLREIVEGLSHIHQQGIIHRDLKPVNIFIDSEDHVKIGDLGLATTNILHNTLKATGEPGLLVGMGSRSAQVSETILNNGTTVVGTTALTSHTGQVGTALYVAPELNTFGLKASYNQKVDIYSLGIIFFEMCYHPLNTTMERLKVLTDLRQPDCVFPSDFPENSNPEEVYVIRWLLNHDASKRPSSQELLQSEHIPPPQLEDAELQEMVRHTLSNPQSKAYKHLVAACFNQEVSAAQDITYDMSIVKGGNYISLLEQTSEKVRRVFKLHGAISVMTPLFTPCGRATGYSLPESSVRVMTRWGGIITAPYDLRLAFARYLAHNPSITQLKRYAVDRVYRERRVLGFHPRELYECAFDIITPTAGSHATAEAELLSVVWEILAQFPSLLQKSCLIRLNHTSIVKAILLHCGIEQEGHEKVCMLLSRIKLQDGTSTKSQIESTLIGNGFSEHTVSMLFTYIEIEHTYEKVYSVLKPLMKKSGIVYSLCKQGLLYLEQVINYTTTLGVECPIMVTPGLVNDMRAYSGMMCQVVWDHRNKRGRVERNVIAAGGRYDMLIQSFRQMLDVPKEVSQYAAGISLSLDKLVSALQTQADCYSSNVCNGHNGGGQKGLVDVLVCSFGQNIRCIEQLTVLRDLWATGISCSSMETTQSLEEIQSGCIEMNIPHIVILKDSERGAVRVRSWVKDRFQERWMPQSDLVDQLQRIIKSQPSTQESSSSSLSIAVAVTKSEPKTVPESSQALVNVAFLTLEKLNTANKRRYETQVMNCIGSLLQKLSPKVRVEVLVLSLEIEVIKMLASQVDLDKCDIDVSSIIKRFPRHKKYLERIFDQIQDVTGTVRRNSAPVMVLYSLVDNAFKVVL